MPMRLPPNASSADSPPVEPPGEYLSLCGLLHCPPTSLVDSKERRVVGRFVFTKGPAPASFNNCTIGPSLVYGLPTFLEYPTEISNPLTCIESFSDTGMPANGPFRLISFSAHSSASGKRISVTQFVFSCAFIATFPYARRTSTGLVTCFCTSWTSSWMGLPRMVRSCGDNGYW